MSAAPSGGLGDNAVAGGSTLKPYLKRKKSSLGETKIAVLGAEGVGKSGKSSLRELRHNVCLFVLFL